MFCGNVPRSRKTSETDREDGTDPIADELKLAFSSLHRVELYMRSWPRCLISWAYRNMACELDYPNSHIRITPLIRTWLDTPTASKDGELKTAAVRCTLAVEQDPHG